MKKTTIKDAAWGQRIFALFCAGTGVGAAMLAPTSIAATLNEDVLQLVGTWDGADADASHGGATFHLEIAAAAAETGLFATATMAASDAAMMAPTSLSMLQDAGSMYGLTSGDGTPEGAYVVEHAPFGGIRLARLTRGQASLAPLALQMEEIVISKAATDGSRKLKLSHGEQRCVDSASHAFSGCGAATTRTYVMKRAAP